MVEIVRFFKRLLHTIFAQSPPSHSCCQTTDTVGATPPPTVRWDSKARVSIHFGDDGREGPTRGFGIAGICGAAAIGVQLLDDHCGGRPIGGVGRGKAPQGVDVDSGPDPKKVILCLDLFVSNLTIRGACGSGGLGTNSQGTRCDKNKDGWIKETTGRHQRWKGRLPKHSRGPLVGVRGCRGPHQPAARAVQSFPLW